MKRPITKSRSKGPRRAPLADLVVLTIGHSTRPIDTFIELLKAHGVQRLVDVRTVPRSRHNPQFEQDALRESMRAEKIGYRHMTGLGGLRHAQRDSINTGWRNASFRGYADYMQTEDFERNLEKLVELAKLKRTAIMCAEAVPWRCHRSLIADALLARGIQAEHIMSATRLEPHELTSFAQVDGSRVTYPALNRQSKLDFNQARGRSRTGPLGIWRAGA